MTIKEAIGQLKCNVEGDYINLDDLEAFNLAIPALEKQIPKKPIKTPDNHKWFCPTCHNPIRFGRNHCCNCGQKIG